MKPLCFIRKLSWLLFFPWSKPEPWTYLSSRSIFLLLQVIISKQTLEHPFATKQVFLCIPYAWYSFGTAATRWHSRIDISQDTVRNYYSSPNVFVPPFNFCLEAFSWFLSLLPECMQMWEGLPWPWGMLTWRKPLAELFAKVFWHQCRIAMSRGSGYEEYATWQSIWDISPAQAKGASFSLLVHHEHGYSPRCSYWSCGFSCIGPISCWL